ncbi:hypothetical protein KY363_04305 [Candidatus Woesearchaeota archaeon]|nr:hypothetical protein [Candidatus Woesearchaeota archaeon]
MEEQLLYTTFSPLIRQVVTEVKSLVQQNRGSKDKLEELLQQRFSDIDHINQAIIEELRVNDAVLEELGNALAGYLTGKEDDREYQIAAKCNSCAESSKKTRQRQAKRLVQVPLGSLVSQPAVSTRDEPGSFEGFNYIHELDFRSGSALDFLKSRGYTPDCPVCGDSLEVITKRNVIYPADDRFVYAILQRVKSAGRYCEKLVDLIFYDSNNPDMSKRSITDRYAFAIIVNQPSGMRDDTFRKEFQRRYGIPVPSGNIEDASCYAVYNLLQRYFRPGPRQLDDKIKHPKKRVSQTGRPELYKMLQFNLPFKGKRFEGQIKSKDTWLREQDRKSGLYHETWEEIERELRQDLYDRMPEMRAVYDTLYSLFTIKQHR